RVDVVQLRRGGAGEVVGVRGADHHRRGAIGRVGRSVGQGGVSAGHGGGTRVDAEVLPGVAGDAQQVGHRVEVHAEGGAGQREGGGAALGRHAGGGVDRVEPAGAGVVGDRVEHPVGGADVDAHDRLAGAADQAGDVADGGDRAGRRRV